MDRLLEQMKNCGAHVAGAVPLEALAPRMGGDKLSRAKRELDDVKSLICGVFPYFADLKPGNISLYARGQDYHTALKSRLEFAAKGFAQQHPGHGFRVYVDASPYPEVYAAAMCGLGAVGSNGLLITSGYGSFVFIGTIASTMQAARPRPVEWCRGCGRCIRACPTGALGDNGVDKARCLSEITQLKGPLTPWQQQAVARAGMAWGCDICQKVCPMNRDMPVTYLPEFNRDLMYSITPQQAELSAKAFAGQHGERAFLWRGMGPLRRNLELIAKD